MKKLLCLLSVVIVFISLVLCGCFGNKEIKSITINDKTYYSLYIYSFDNAEISNVSKSLYASEDLISELSKIGYAISKNIDTKKIKVYNEYIFSQDTNTSLSDTDFGCQAEVVELIQDYPIEIKTNKDTHTITYYIHSGVSTASNLNMLTDNIEKHIVEIAKENVVIEYFN